MESLRLSPFDDRPTQKIHDVNASESRDKDPRIKDLYKDLCTQASASVGVDSRGRSSAVEPGGWYEEQHRPHKLWGESGGPVNEKTKDEADAIACGTNFLPQDVVEHRGAKRKLAGSERQQVSKQREAAIPSIQIPGWRSKVSDGEHRKSVEFDLRYSRRKVVKPKVNGSLSSAKARNVELASPSRSQFYEVPIEMCLTTTAPEKCGDSPAEAGKSCLPAPYSADADNPRPATPPVLGPPTRVPEKLIATSSDAQERLARSRRSNARVNYAKGQSTRIVLPPSFEKEVHGMRLTPFIPEMDVQKVRADGSTATALNNGWVRPPNSLLRTSYPFGSGTAKTKSFGRKSANPDKGSRTVHKKSTTADKHRTKRKKPICSRVLKVLVSDHNKRSFPPKKLKCGYVSEGQSSDVDVDCEDIQHPSFSLEMKHSNVVTCFWLSIPADFDTLYLPREDACVVLEDSEGFKWETNYLARKRGLSGGWRRFVLDQSLVMGDKLVFELVRPLKLKVHITRVSERGRAYFVAPDSSAAAALPKKVPKHPKHPKSGQRTPGCPTALFSGRKRANKDSGEGKKPRKKPHLAPTLEEQQYEGAGYARASKAPAKKHKRLFSSRDADEGPLLIRNMVWIDDEEGGHFEDYRAPSRFEQQDDSEEPGSLRATPAWAAFNSDPVRNRRRSHAVKGKAKKLEQNLPSAKSLSGEKMALLVVDNKEGKRVHDEVLPIAEKSPFNSSLKKQQGKGRSAAASRKRNTKRVSYAEYEDFNTFDSRSDSDDDDRDPASIRRGCHLNFSADDYDTSNVRSDSGDDRSEPTNRPLFSEDVDIVGIESEDPSSLGEDKVDFEDYLKSPARSVSSMQDPQDDDPITEPWVRNRSKLVPPSTNGAKELECSSEEMIQAGKESDHGEEFGETRVPRQGSKTRLEDERNYGESDAYLSMKGRRESFSDLSIKGMSSSAGDWDAVYSVVHSIPADDDRGAQIVHPRSPARTKEGKDSESPASLKVSRDEEGEESEPCRVRSESRKRNHPGMPRCKLVWSDSDEEEIKWVSQKSTTAVSSVKHRSQDGRVRQLVRALTNKSTKTARVIHEQEHEEQQTKSVSQKSKRLVRKDSLRMQDIRVAQMVRVLSKSRKTARVIHEQEDKDEGPSVKPGNPAVIAKKSWAPETRKTEEKETQDRKSFGALESGTQHVKKANSSKSVTPDQEDKDEGPSVKPGSPAVTAKQSWIAETREREENKMQERKSSGALESGTQYVKKANSSKSVTPDQEVKDEGPSVKPGNPAVIAKKSWTAETREREKTEMQDTKSSGAFESGTQHVKKANSSKSLTRHQEDKDEGPLVKPCNRAVIAEKSLASETREREGKEVQDRKSLKKKANSIKSATRPEKSWSSETREREEKVMQDRKSLKKKANSSKSATRPVAESKCPTVKGSSRRAKVIQSDASASDEELNNRTRPLKRAKSRKSATRLVTGPNTPTVKGSSRRALVIQDDASASEEEPQNGYSSQNYEIEFAEKKVSAIARLGSEDPCGSGDPYTPPRAELEPESKCDECIGQPLIVIERASPVQPWYRPSKRARIPHRSKDRQQEKVVVHSQSRGRFRLI